MDESVAELGPSSEPRGIRLCILTGIIKVAERMKDMRLNLQFTK